MKHLLSAIVFTLLVTCLVISDANARGGRGGGGGGARGGGGHAAARPGGSGGGARTPSMSRPQARPTSRPAASRPPSGSRPNMSRPTPGGNHPNINRPNPGGGRPDLNRPAPGGNRPNINRPGTGSNRPNLSGRPSASDLGGFLGLPANNRPTTLPGRVDRPNLGDRPNIGNQPNINVGNSNRVNINRQRNVNSIRNNWAHTDRRPFSQNWWGRYPSTLPGWRWHAGWSRYPGSWYWRHARWPVVGTWFVWQWTDPAVYNYGTNVVYRDNYVYVDDQQVATTDDYYQQAVSIAEGVPEEVGAEQIEWMPLGVYAIAEDGDTDSGMLVQLAVSKEGIIAGTFYIDATDEGRPLEGMVDRETQRASWKFADGKNNDVVMETAIYNLTQDESTALVHFGADKTQTWLMVRLPESKEEKQ